MAPQRSDQTPRQLTAAMLSLNRFRPTSIRVQQSPAVSDHTQTGYAFWQTSRTSEKVLYRTVIDQPHLAEEVAEPAPLALRNPPTRVTPLILDVDGSGLPLLGMEPAPKTARLRVISIGTRTGEAVDVLGDDLIPTSRGLLSALPFASDVFDAVAVAGTLEHVVADDDALDEMARVLRPGGLLFLRVPHDDRLAWLDAQNLYTYISGTIGRGQPLAGRPALKFRRHYGREDLLNELTKRGLKARIVTTEGWGAGEILLLGTLLVCRSILGSPQRERRMRAALAPFRRGERRLRAGSFGRDITVVAEKRERGCEGSLAGDDVARHTQVSSVNSDRSSATS